MTAVLVVDDDPDMCAYVAACVIRQGHNAITAADGLAGLEMLEISMIDLVITDICMPRKDGIGLISDMAKRFPAIPVIAMTGDPHLRQTVERALQPHAASAVLGKPFLPHQLAAAMQALLPPDRVRAAAGR